MRDGLRHSIDALRCRLESYDMELWSILCEQETCKASVRELEEALAAEASTDEEEELVQERARDEVVRRLAACQRGKVEESEEEHEEDQEQDEEEGDEEDEDELEGSSRLLAKARGKCPAK